MSRFLNLSLPLCLCFGALIPQLMLAVISSELQFTPDFSFPVRHGFSTKAQTWNTNSIDRSAAAASPVGIRSKLITLNESLGEYFAVMQLGTPPTEIAVIIDTGSELVWVQCQPCIHCEGQILDPIFKPASSKTFRNITCNSPWCNEEYDGGATLSCGKSTNDVCLFNTSYVDGSNSEGYLAGDTLSVVTTENKGMKVPNFVFGCAEYDTGTSLNASGTMGLDRGNHSAVSQLGVQVFSYCLPDRSNKIDSVGYITFGKASRNHSLNYTKLLHNTATKGVDKLYYVNLTGISVGDKLLNIPASALQLNLTSGSGGTIIDSGTTLTYLMDGAYRVFRDAIISQITGDAVPVSIPGYSLLELCYVIVGGDLGIPTVTMHFEGGVDLNLPVQNIMVRVASNTYCLAFGNAGEIGEGMMNIIGNFQQQSILVEIDVGRSEIGFAHNNCSAETSKEGSAISPASGMSPTTSISPASGGGTMTPAPSPTTPSPTGQTTPSPASKSPQAGGSPLSMPPSSFPSNPSSPPQGSSSTSPRLDACSKLCAVSLIVIAIPYFML